MSYDRASKLTEITILYRISNNENIYQKYKEKTKILIFNFLFVKDEKRNIKVK